MCLHLTPQKCPLCSRLSSRLKKLISRFYVSGLDCQDIHLRTHETGEKRAAEINAAAPDCACEKNRMSKHSPHPIKNSETLARFIFSPMLVDSKGNAKPNGFSHVNSKGCSIQRDSIARNDELSVFVEKFLSGKDERAWKGVLYGHCGEIRSISNDDSGQREICVYDTANLENPSHGELFQSQYVVEEADRVELRSKLFNSFNNGKMIAPRQFRDGVVWNNLSQPLQTRGQ